MGWLPEYSHRIRFKIDHAKIDSDLTHFPITLFLTEDNADAVFNELGSNYKKIAVTSDDGTTQLYVEVEVWDSANKQAVLHISRSSWTISSSSDTYFYLYYDASVADNTTYVGDPGDSVAANVWDDNFKAVYHLSQNPTGGNGCIKDSTSNNNDGTPHGSMTSDDLVDGGVGKALDFDGSDDYVDCGSDGSLDITGPLTIESVVKLSSTGGSQAFFEGRLQYTLWVNSSGRVRLADTQGNYCDSDSGDFAWDVYQYVAGKFSGSSGDSITTSNAAVFINDANVTAATGGTWLPQSLSTAVIACSPQATPISFADGLIDEVRISNVARSDAWIKATYYSLFNSLITVCEHVTAWSYRKKITISGSPGAGTGYQVLLKVGESSGASNCDFHVEGHSAKFPSGTNDSGDLRFVDNDGSTFLNFWVEKVEGEAPNRVAYCWVKINDNLDSDVNIYCYYGNPGTGNVSNGKNTFEFFDDFSIDSLSNYDLISVFHFGDGTDDKTAGTYDVVNQRVNINTGDNLETVYSPKNFTIRNFHAQAKFLVSGGYPYGATGTVVGRYQDDNNMYTGQKAAQQYSETGGTGSYCSYTSPIIRKWVASTESDIATPPSNNYIPMNTETILALAIYENNIKFFVDGSEVLSTTDSDLSDAGRVAFGAGQWEGWLDEIRVRKYVSPEPSFSTAGDEEQLVGPTWYQAISCIRNRLYEIAYNSKHYLTSTFYMFFRIWGGDITKVKNKVFADALTLIANQVRSYQLVVPHLIQHWDGPEGDYRLVPPSTRERPWWWWPYSCGEPVSKGQEGINYSRISKDRRYDTFFSPQRYYWGVIVGTPYSRTPSSYAGKTIEDKPKNFFWNRVYVVPTKIDFGFTKVGSSRLIHILHRYEDTSHDLQSVSSSDPTFSVTLPEPLPHTMAPGAEMDGLVNVAQVGAVRVVDAPIYFHFDTVGDAICYVSATFAIVLLKPRKYDQWNTPHTFQKIKFKFETELVHNLASKPTRIPKLYYPTRSSSLHLGAVDEVAYDLDYDAINAARYLVVVPEFPLRVRLVSNAHQHDTQIVVEDVTDFEVGYSAVLCSSRHLEAGQITEIDAASKTLKFAGQLQYDYDVNDTWVYPSFTGYGHVRRTRSLVKHNVYNLEIDVDEIIPEGCNALTGTTSQWYKRPRTVLVEGSVVDSRDVKGLEVGVPSIKNPLSSRLRDKIVVTHSYQFFGTAWRDFKDLFLYAKGRYQKVNIITWLSELRVYEDAYQGSASLKIIPRTYSEIWSAYKKVVIDYGSTIVHTTVTGVVTAEDHCVVTLQDNLSLDTPKGTPLHFKIDAYLTEDTIEFDFKGDGCFVTVTWEEAYD
ncbi:DUF2341 domain-containing protein [bacterium]|nr:DUF2341 domain-containing protein [bacterium]